MSDPSSPVDEVQVFTLSGYEGAPTRGTANIQRFHPAERWRRRLAALVKWWGLAILSVFIPVAHFVLVPAFLIFGGLQFFARLRTAELVVSARGMCPDCGAEQALELAPRWQAPQSVTCRSCQRGLVLALPPADRPAT